MINKCCLKYLQISLSWFLEVQLWTAVVDKLPKLSAWPGIALFLCMGGCWRSGYRPAESCCAVQRSLGSWLQAHSPVQEKAVCVSHPLETLSNQSRFGHILVCILHNCGSRASLCSHSCFSGRAWKERSSRERLPRNAQSASSHSLWTPHTPY